MASTYLTRTPSSASNRKTWTFSAWVKRSNPSGVNVIFQQGIAGNYFKINFQGGVLRWRGVTSGSNQAYLTTNRVFRDTSAWYHIVARFDSTNATAGDRMRLYINGVEETSFSTDVNPPLNYEGYVNTTDAIDIGRDNTANDSFFEGSMSHVHFIDGTAYDASAFGETDATTGEWVGKTSPSVTYGTNGFFILKDGNGITDQSGEGNDFTLGGGTLTDLKDNPDNVFATWNALDNYYPAMTLSYGNTRALTISGKYTYIPSTLGMTSGKYYAEIKCTAQSGSQEEFLVGIISTSTTATTHEVGHYGNNYGYRGLNGNYRSSDVDGSYGSTYTTGDIIGIAVDLDNNKLYFSKNGTWQNSGDPTSGATGTGAISITDPTSTLLGGYFFAVCYFSSTNTGTYDANFGNGYFGTTAVSSAGTNASDNGIFEYDVPTGYTALSTKGLNL
jgi:hypothetical protein